MFIKICLRHHCEAGIHCNSLVKQWSIKCYNPIEKWSMIWGSNTTSPQLTWASCCEILWHWKISRDPSILKLLSFCSKCCFQGCRLMSSSDGFIFIEGTGSGPQRCLFIILSTSCTKRIILATHEPLTQYLISRKGAYIRLGFPNLLQLAMAELMHFSNHAFWGMSYCLDNIYIYIDSHEYWGSLQVRHFLFSGMSASAQKSWAWNIYLLSPIKQVTCVNKLPGCMLVTNWMQFSWYWLPEWGLRTITIN